MFFLRVLVFYPDLSSSADKSEKDAQIAHLASKLENEKVIFLNVNIGKHFAYLYRGSH